MIRFGLLSYRWRLTLFVGVALVSSEVSAVDFNRDIRPILSNHCFQCHGPDEHDRHADLRLDVEAEAAGVLEGGTDSDFVLRILSDDPDEVMPPPEVHKALEPEQIALLKDWIEEGAPYEVHWAYQPLVRPPVPTIAGQKPINPIDGFVNQRLEDQNLPWAQPADRITLARRLHFDLWGLPPSAEQVSAFLDDTSPGANERLVSQLLANPKFGERLAVFWLDLVRYADTIGYHSDTYMEVSAFREWVIAAFNKNKPFDEFTIEQLAGDLLPDATNEQKIASGYNRLLQTTEEGGAQPGEYMAIYAADRVRNVSAVWMGSTLGCAQCHDHKYDPFTARDFYSMAAFFADIKERPVGKRVPNLKIHSEEQRSVLEAMKQQLAENELEPLLVADPSLVQRLAEGQAVWEANALDEARARKEAWSPVNVKDVKATNGIEFALGSDGSVLSLGAEPDKSTYTVTLEATGTVRAIRMEVLTHKSFKRKKGLSREQGNFVLTDLRVTAKGKPVLIDGATADYSQKGYEIAKAIDDDSASGWAVDGHTKKEERAAVFALAAPIEFGEDGGELVVTLAHDSVHKRHQIGRFRFTVSDFQTTVESGLPSAVAKALEVPAEDRDDSQSLVLRDHYRTLAPELQDSRQKTSEAQARIKEIERVAKTMLAAESLEEPRMTRILNRGDWMDEEGEVVLPAVPAFLPQPSFDARRKNEDGPAPRSNRLDLARWIVDEANPLTARTFVNRLWALFYGQGLSANLEDLGGQGEPPTYSDLLDWLAIEFQESGWDVKHMVRLMVTSDAYRQSSLASAEQLAMDSANRQLARQGRWRVDAEFVRDAALQLSGLLKDESQVGKSVKPYQPAGYWQHLNFPQRKWEQDSGGDLYRRSLYTFWCRSFPHPSLLAFDAPSREECTARRARSNIPQQALVLLNDPIYLEASRVFAERIIAKGGTPAEQVAWAWEQAVSRAPDDEEQRVLLQLLDQQTKRYEEDADAARELVAIGVTKPASDVPVEELAAWTQVARAIINTYEMTSRF